MAKCALDLSHPYFQRSIRQFRDDPDFNHGLLAAKAKIEAEHTSCHRVVQPFNDPKYQDCFGKIWKYDWAPDGARGSNRKSWRLIVVVPQPNSAPYKLIAAAAYSKAASAQLSLRELALIFLSVTAPEPEIAASAGDSETSFRHIEEDNGVIRSICQVCGETVKVDLPAEVITAEKMHSCPGPIW